MKREGLTAEYVINMTRCVLIHLIFDLGAFYGHKKCGHSLKSSFGEKIIYVVSLTCPGTILPRTKYIILHKCFIHENQSFSRSCEIIHQNFLFSAVVIGENELPKPW